MSVVVVAAAANEKKSIWFITFLKIITNLDKLVAFAFYLTSNDTSSSMNGPIRFRIDANTKGTDRKILIFKLSKQYCDKWIFLIRENLS